MPKLAKLRLKERDLVLIDGDTLEEKNLDRQLFSPGQIGRKKADALKEVYGISASVCSYFNSGMAVELKLNSDDVLWCCADNHACRLNVLRACDRYECRAVFGANEYEEAEAYWYESSLLNTLNDPRIFYPVITSDRSGDPLAPEGCTGDAQVASPQLVLANDWASSMMLQLFYFHDKIRPGMDPEQTRQFWPVGHKVNPYKFSTIKLGDRC